MTYDDLRTFLHTVARKNASDASCSFWHQTLMMCCSSSHMSDSAVYTLLTSAVLHITDGDRLCTDRGKEGLAF